MVGRPTVFESSESEWPEFVNPQSNDHTLAELAKNPAQDTTHVLTTVACNGLLNLNNIIDCQKFSKWIVLLRVTARVLRFIKTCRGTPLKAINVQYSNDSELEAAELERAETLWIRSVQGEAFERVVVELWVLQPLHDTWTVHAAIAIFRTAARGFALLCLCACVYPYAMVGNRKINL